MFLLPSTVLSLKLHPLIQSLQKPFTISLLTSPLFGFSPSLLNCSCWSGSRQRSRGWLTAPRRTLCLSLKQGWRSSGSTPPPQSPPRERRREPWRPTSTPSRLNSALATGLHMCPLRGSWCLTSTLHGGSWSRWRRLSRSSS